MTYIKVKYGHRAAWAAVSAAAPGRGLSCYEGRVAIADVPPAGLGLN